MDDERLAVSKVLFSKEAIDAIAAALPSGTDPARSVLLPKILCVWAEEDLHEHLSRGGRAAAREREKQLRRIGAQAQKLIDAVEALDHLGSLKTAFQPQMRRAGTGQCDTDIGAAKQRRDQTVSWLIDLAEIFNGSGATRRMTRSRSLIRRRAPI